MDTKTLKNKIYFAIEDYCEENKISDETLGAYNTIMFDEINGVETIVEMQISGEPKLSIMADGSIVRWSIHMDEQKLCETAKFSTFKKNAINFDCIKKEGVTTETLRNISAQIVEALTK